MNNVYKLVETIAGSAFNIVSADTNCPTPTFTLEHCKCGNKFGRTLNEISAQGIHCDRCERHVLGNTILKDAKRVKALHVYNQCKALIPDDFTIKGDTSDESNVIKVTDTIGNTFDISIKDLLENRNLPDCLVRRDVIHPSPALSILDTLFDDYTVLDDFNTLYDEVRIRSNANHIVKKMSVNKFLESMKQYE